MKSRVKLTSICFILAIFILATCKKNGVRPTVETSAITEVSTLSARCGGTVISEGSGPVTARGVCWAARLNPTINDIKSQDGSGTGSFTSKIEGLNEGVAYFVRAYATNSSGTSYGITKSFIAAGQSPSLSVAAATNVTSVSATLNGTVNPNSLLTTVIFKYGISTVYDSTKVAGQSPLNTDSYVSVSADISKLTPSTVYHYRIIATNSLGSSFSSDITFTTKGK